MDSKVYLFICIAVVLFAIAPSTYSLDILSLGKLANAVQTFVDIIRSIEELSSTLSSVIPHSFPFGGPILSSERACELGFKAWVYIPNPLCLIGVCTPPTVPVPAPIDIPLGGSAIEVGPPVPSGGKIITFPWVSKIFDNHTENREGPWALGLGFTPFPLDEINNALEGITVWIPPKPSIGCPDPFAIYPPGTTCITDFHFECVASGEKDPNGNDIYKVIRLLGTSKENVTGDALQRLQQNFPGFTWP